MLKALIDTKCHFAIKSGGHDRTPGSSNADGGVTIDLVRLNEVKVAKDRKSVKIGAGLRWLDVYTALEKEGLMVVGGRVSDVGVGGLTLGGKMIHGLTSLETATHADGLLGGISFFSNRYGWACDNVLSYDIVLPDTSIETVTQSSQPDLYRSLRGAGASNFGIVTSFTMETFPQPNPAGIWGGSKVFAWDKAPELLRMSNKFTMETMDIDPDVALISSFGYMQAYDIWWGVPIFRHTTHTNPSTWPSPFQPYENLEGVPNTTNIAIRPLSNITLELAQSSPVGERTIYGTFTYHPSIALEQKILDLFSEQANSIKNISEFLPTAIIQPLSRTTIRKMKKRGGNALGITEEGPLTIFSTSWKWRHASDDDRSYAAYYRFMERAEAVAKEMRVWHPYRYINYAEATQDVWSGLGEVNLRDLRRVQRSTDPKGVFARGGLGGGYFKLNDMPGEEERKRGGTNGEGLKSEL